jgi:hypothetical protein
MFSSHLKISMVVAQMLRTVSIKQICVLLVALCTIFPALALDPVLPGRLKRIMTPDGALPDAFTAQPYFSKDGRYLAFSSKARNLLPGIPSSVSDAQLYRQWYLLDRQTNALERISVNNLGEPQAGPNPNNSNVTGTSGLDISPDGRYVVFVSPATNLDGIPPTGNSLFLRDRLSRTTRRISPINMPAFGPQFSANSNFIRFLCSNTRVCTYEFSSGVVSSIEIPKGYQVLASFSRDGKYVICARDAPEVFPGASYAARCDLELNLALDISVAAFFDAALSANGSVMVFSRSGLADGSDPNFPPGYNVYVWREATGAIELISRGPFSDSAFDFNAPSVDISDDGTRVAFVSENPNLGALAFDSAFARNVVYVRDIGAGASSINRITALLEIERPGIPLGPGIASCERVPITSPSFIFTNVTAGPNCPELSGDGRSIAFSSHDARWLPGDNTFQQDCPGQNELCPKMLDVYYKPVAEPFVVTTVPTFDWRIIAVLAGLMLLIGVRFRR